MGRISRACRRVLVVAAFWGLVAPFSVEGVAAEERDDSSASAEESEASRGEEAAEGSNPLSSVSKVDLLWTFTKDGGSDFNDFSLEGSTMLHPRLKLNYELHYAVTNRTGYQENDWESLVIKPIFFPRDFRLSERWGMRVATGVELAIDFGNEDKGIGVGSDVIGPLVGLAFMDAERRTVLIPLVQHYESYESSDVSQTALRLIALQPLPDGSWVKLDGKLPLDWENHEQPASLELEAGKVVWRNVALFGQLLSGIGGDRAFDWGAAAALRINF